MAITASTSSYNAISRKGSGNSVFESAKNVLSSSVSYNQGDILAFDTSAKVLKVVSTTADSANVLGVADNVVVSGKLVGPYTGLTAVDAAEAIGDVAGPRYGVEALMKVHTGASLTPGCKLYLSDGDDSQTLAVTDPGDGNYIGIYQGVAVTAAAGARYPVLIGARYGAAMELS